MQPVVERQVLEDGQVELVVDQGPSRRGATAPRGPCSGGIFRDAEAFVGDPVLVAHAERERRVVVEEERRGVVVEAEEQHVGLLLGEPLRHRLVALEERLPVRVVLLAPVERHRDRGDVRGADAADDARHG